MKNALLVILIIFWKILVFFPRRFQNFIATVLGHFINWLPLKRNLISKVNIDLCFKDLSQKIEIIFIKKIQSNLPKLYLIQVFHGFGLIIE